eukprot:1177312-Prorocentrum_minimum.AAC.2
MPFNCRRVRLSPRLFADATCRVMSPSQWRAPLPPAGGGRQQDVFTAAMRTHATSVCVLRVTLDCISTLPACDGLPLLAPTLGIYSLPACDRLPLSVYTLSLPVTGSHSRYVLSPCQSVQVKSCRRLFTLGPACRSSSWNQSQGTIEYIPGVGTNHRGLYSICYGGCKAFEYVQRSDGSVAGAAIPIKVCAMGAGLTLVVIGARPLTRCRPRPPSPPPGTTWRRRTGRCLASGTRW